MRRIATEYAVHTGRPSWHQARAGHYSSAVMLFWRKRDAQRFLRRCKRLRPDEPAFIVTSRKLRPL